MKINISKILHSRNMLWQVPLLFVILSPLWWGAAKNFLKVESIQASSKPTSKAKSNFSMSTIKLSQAKDGKEEIRLDAVHVYSEDDQDILYLQEPVTKLVAKKDSPVTITSGNAVYEMKKQIFTLLDDVQLLSDDTLVTTSAMRYLSKYKKVKSAAEIELNSDGMRITGTSFFYDLVNGDFRVGKRVVCNLW